MAELDVPKSIAQKAVMEFRGLGAFIREEPGEGARF
jgi:hypothetical protein